MAEPDEETLTELITGFTRSVLGREAQSRGLSLGLSGVKVFKVVRADVDGDGEEEICFAAGVAEFFSQGVCGVLDPSPHGPRFAELVSFQEGFRDLLVTDLDSDGHPEIVTWSQIGSGAMLSLAILRYDGSAVTSLFPGGPFHQGLLETKDLDLDGVDELVIWEGRWEKGAHWAPNPFTVHVYHAARDGYAPAFSHQLTTSYYPADIVSRTIGLVGLPTVIEHRYSSVAERRRQFESRRAAGQITDEYVTELGGQTVVLREEGFLDEALSVLAIVAEANELLPPSPLTRQRSVMICRERALTASLFGDYPAAVQACSQAIDRADAEALQGLPGYYRALLYRDLASTEAFLGDYEQALAAQATAFALLGQLDASDAEVRGELSRLHSNAGLVRSWIGDETGAIGHFRAAIGLDTELNRSIGRSINETGIANVHRRAGRAGEAISWYEAALRSLSEVSDRDRESDANLELGLALIETGQPDAGLARILTALLLTSVGNLRQQDWKHYLYLGEAYRARHDHDMAGRAFRKASAAAGRSATSEVHWQARYGLGLVLRDLGRPDEARACLEEAIDAAERFRRQYLPEALKISMLASKANPYEALVDLLASPEGHGDAPGWAAAAFGYVEEAKSRVFLERLAISPIRWPESAPAELLAEETQLIDALRALTVRESAARDGASGPAELDRLEDKLNDVWGRIEASGRDGAEYVSLRRGRPVAYDGILGLLRDGA